MARSQRGAPAIRVHQMGKCEGAHDGGFYQLFLLHVCSAPVLHHRHVAERGGEALWSSQVCTSPVTPAEWQRGANGCCYARLPEHLLRVTLLFHCHLAPSDRHERPAISVSPSKPAPDGCHFFETINDLCCRAAAFGAGSAKIWQLDYFNYVLRSRQGFLWKTKTAIIKNN